MMIVGILKRVTQVLRDAVTALVVSILLFLLSQSGGLSPELSISRLATFEVTSIHKLTHGLISLSIDGTQPTSDTYVHIYDIRNSGNAPIKIDDYFEPISVRVPDGFALTVIESMAIAGSIADVPIHQVDQQSAYIEPTLLNRDDFIRVFLTMKSDDVPQGEANLGGLNIEKPTWNARITNIDRLTVEDNKSLSSIEGKVGSTPVIFIAGHEIAQLLILASLLLALLCVLFFRLLPSSTGWKPTTFVLIAAILSYSCAESLIYLHSPWAAPDYWINLSVVIAYSALSLCLLTIYIIKKLRLGNSPASLHDEKPRNLSPKSRSTPRKRGISRGTR